MRPTFRTRQAIKLALVANALRPVRSAPAAVPSFFAGWLTAEFAPHLLALTGADSAAHLIRRGKTDPAGLAAAGGAAAGLIRLMGTAHGARATMEQALTEALGERYHSQLSPPPHDTDLDLPLGELAMPFPMRSPEVRRTRDVAYQNGGKRYLLDIYQPRSPARDCPVLLQVHGGAWMVGNKNQQGIPLMLHMARRGWVCVSINYPLSPAAKWPAHIVAAKQAVAWIKENIAAYGGNPSFLATTGGSAGGHLAALLALTPNDPEWQPGFTDVDTSVQACVPHYGAYDFTAQGGSKAARVLRRWVLERYVMGENTADGSGSDPYVAASPLARINESAPPFFVVHGTHDSLLPAVDARTFVAKLRSNSAEPVAYAEVPGGQHAFDLFPSIRSAHVVRGVQRFLEWAHARHGRHAPTGATGAAVEGEHSR